MDKLVVKFEGTTLEETVGHNIYKTFQDLFLPGKEHDNMVPEGIQSNDLYKIRLGSGDKRHQVSPPKTNLRKFTVPSIASTSTIRS